MPKPGSSRKSHGCVLWLEGASDAASTKACRSVAPSVIPPLRVGAHVMRVHCENSALGVNQDFNIRFDVVPVMRH